jgi:polygalacturonase
MKKQHIITKALVCLAFASVANVNQTSAQQKISETYSWDHLPTAKVPSFKRDTFNIVKFGAISTPSSLNTKSVTDAIDECAKQGGGVVLIPKGIWLTGPIRLKSNVNLHLAKGAKLEFSPNKDLYPLVSGNFEGRQTVRNQSPISGDDLENVAITGNGIIEGNGDVWRPLAKGKQTDEQWAAKLSSGGVMSDDGKTWYPSLQSKRGQALAKSGELDKLSTIEEFRPIKDYLRPNLVVLTSCKSVLLEGVTFQNSPAWCLHPLMCTDLTIRRVFVNNPPWAQNGDGLDIESCKNVLVENSKLECGDDGLCIKSGKDEQGRKRGMPCENITIHDDTVYHAHGGFVIGSEMSGGAKNIFVYHCAFIGTDKGLRFKTARGRGGVVSDIYVKDIYMKDIVQEAVYFDMYYFTKPPVSGEKPPVFPVDVTTPRFQDFYISDIKCDNSDIGIFVRGLPEMSIRNINFQNIQLTSATGVQIIEADNIHLKNIRVDATRSKPLVYIENSRNIDFTGLESGKMSDLLFNISGNRSKKISASGVKVKKNIEMAKFTDQADKNVLTVR